MHVPDVDDAENGAKAPRNAQVRWRMCVGRDPPADRESTPNKATEPPEVALGGRSMCNTQIAALVLKGVLGMHRELMA